MRYYRPTKDTRFLLQQAKDNFLSRAFRPLKTALDGHDDIVRLLISLGAEFNTGIMAPYTHYANEDAKQSILDWVNAAIQTMEMEIKRGQKAKEEPKPVDFSKLTSCATLTVKITNSYLWCHLKLMDKQITEVERMESTKRYFEDVKELLVSLGAKTWSELENVEKLKSDSTGRALFGFNRRNLANPETETSFEDYEFAALSFYRLINLPRHLLQVCTRLFHRVSTLTLV